MIKDRGIDALINECLIGPVLGMGAVFIGVLCAFFAFLYLAFAVESTDINGGGWTVFIVAYAFVVGTQVCNVFTTPLSSGIDTIFVAAAWDPEAMIREHPELYQKMIEVYPHVQQ